MFFAKMGNEVHRIRSACTFDGKTSAVAFCDAEGFIEYGRVSELTCPKCKGIHEQLMRERREMGLTGRN
jgi:hypothetical protein